MPVAKREDSTTNRELFVATETGTAVVRGEEYPFKRGVTHVRVGHPILKACPQYFQPAEERVDYDVEAATAGPGEKRR